jgi:hypothetical protein
MALRGPVWILAGLADPAVLEQIMVARGGAARAGARGPPQGEHALG